MKISKTIQLHILLGLSKILGKCLNFIRIGKYFTFLVQTQQDLRISSELVKKIIIWTEIYCLNLKFSIWYQKNIRIDTNFDVELVICNIIRIFIRNIINVYQNRLNLITIVSKLLELEEFSCNCSKFSRNCQKL